MEITDEIITKADEMIKEVGERAGLSKPVKQIVFNMVLGMIKAGSVKLSEIGRAGEENLKTIENKFSYHLNSKRLEDESFRKAHLNWAAEKADIDKDTVLFFDISDITKKYAEAMEYMCEVYDHDKKEKGEGYWEINVEAINKKGRGQMVLWEEIYSQLEPDFKSQNEKVFRVVEEVAKATKGEGIFVFDRGGDDEKLMHKVFDELKKQGIFRQVGDRHAFWIGWKGKGKKAPVYEIAEELPMQYSKLVEVEGKKKRAYYGYCWIKVEGVESKLFLVVVKGLREKPLMLITNISPRGEKGCWKVVGSYLRRWGGEDSERFKKVEFKLEDIRVLRYEAIKKLCLLCALACNLVWMTIKFCPAVVDACFKVVKVFKKEIKFIAYRVRQGMSLLLREKKAYLDTS